MNPLSFFGVPDLSGVEQAPEASEVRCDACDRPIDGEPAGEGVYLWTRGGETVFEPVPLCELCVLAIGVTAQRAMEIDEEEG